ncbi:MAG: VWA domain-containing protein [bacterium]
MGLENPGWLWLLGIIPMFLCLSAGSWRRSSRWLAAFSHERRRPARAALSILSLCLSLAAAVLALAGTKMQVDRTVFNRSGIDLCIGIDVSKSMLAEDVVLPPDGKGLFRLPNRLNRARGFCLDLVSELQGERVGLFMFANRGVELVPFTRDYGYFRYMLRYVNDTEITTSGSDLGEAVLTGLAMLESVGRQDVKRMVLLSDGEDISLDTSSLYESARLAASHGVRIYTAAVGTGRPVLIPIRDAEGVSVVGHYLDEEGSYLRTRLVPETLERIAQTTGGGFLRVDQEDATKKLMDSLLSDARQLEQTRSVERTWIDLSPWLLASGMGFFILGILVKG